MPEPNSNTRWLTLQDLARVTGFSVSFLRTEIKRGALQGTLTKSPSRPRTRGRWRIAETDADAWRRLIGFATSQAPAGSAAA
jgi:hypothetical protein